MTKQKYVYFCPRCGKPTTYNPSRKGLCMDCYLELHKEKIPDVIKTSFVVCVGCGRIKYGDMWFEPTMENIINLIDKKVKRDLKAYDYQVVFTSEDLSNLASYTELKVPLKIYIDDNVVDKWLNIRIDRAFCPLCAQKRSGKYYESIIHIRYTKREEQVLYSFLDRFVNRELSRTKHFEVIDIKKDGDKGIVLRYSNRRMAHSFLGKLNKIFSLIVLKKYKDNITVFINTKKSRVQVEKYIIRIISQKNSEQSVENGI